MKNHLIIALTLSMFTFSCSEEDQPCEKKVWYADLDNDGKGDKNNTYETCTQPVGFVDNADDDNDKPQEGPIIPSTGISSPLTYDGMNLIWSDEFEGTSLDETKWNYELGNNNGWGNNELENYTKENTSIKEGNLIITAKRQTLAGFNYTSSRLTTQNKFDFKYGRIDIRAVLPKGQGIWPAFWLLGKNINQVSWPKCGEIDIMEMVGGSGKDNTVHGTCHWDNAGSYAQYGGSTTSASVLNSEYHLYSIVWNEKEIIWYLDNVKYHVIDITPAGLDEFQKEFFLIFNCAVGGNWPGSPDGSTVFPQHLVVDYIRVFQ